MLVIFMTVPDALKLTTPYVILACSYEGWYERQLQYMR